MRLAGELVSLTRWYARWIWVALATMWRDLPGPWYVKILLITVCVLIPGPQDELALLTLTRVCRVWRAQRARSG